MGPRVAVALATSTVVLGVLSTAGIAGTPRPSRLVAPEPSAEWKVTFDDPHTWTRACHEGNYGLQNILSGARAEDRRST